MRIEVDSTRCSGCRYCELWCSFTHEGVFNPSSSRILVVRDDRIGMDYPIVCRFCSDPLCIKSCPTSALSVGLLGAIEVNDVACIKCGECVKSCPFGAIHQHKLTGKPLVCDLCGGNPVCVRRCPTNALRLAPVGSVEVPRQFSREYQYALSEHRKLMEVWGLDVR